MPMAEEASQTDNFREKFLALKKIFVRQSLVVRTILSDVRQFEVVCREKLNFQFSGMVDRRYNNYIWHQVLLWSC